MLLEKQIDDEDRQPGEDRLRHQEADTAGLREAGAELLLVLNASPCHRDKTRERVQVLADRVEATGMPAIYCNLVGGQDELVFDGDSFALDAGKNVCMRLPQFEEALGIVDFAAGRLTSNDLCDELPLEAEAYNALVLGVRD